MEKVTITIILIWMVFYTALVACMELDEKIIEDDDLSQLLSDFNRDGSPKNRIPNLYPSTHDFNGSPPNKFVTEKKKYGNVPIMESFPALENSQKDKTEVIPKLKKKEEDQKISELEECSDVTVLAVKMFGREIVLTEPTINSKDFFGAKNYIDPTKVKFLEKVNEAIEREVSDIHYDIVYHEENCSTSKNTEFRKNFAKNFFTAVKKAINADVLAQKDYLWDTKNTTKIQDIVLQTYLKLGTAIYQESRRKIINGDLEKNGNECFNDLHAYFHGLRLIEISQNRGLCMESPILAKMVLRSWRSPFQKASFGHDGAFEVLFNEVKNFEIDMLQKEKLCNEEAFDSDINKIDLVHDNHVCSKFCEII